MDPSRTSSSQFPFTTLDSEVRRPWTVRETDGKHRRTETKRNLVPEEENRVLGEKETPPLVPETVEFGPPEDTLTSHSSYQTIVVLTLFEYPSTRCLGVCTKMSLLTLSVPTLGKRRQYLPLSFYSLLLFGLCCVTDS